MKNCNIEIKENLNNIITSEAYSSKQALLNTLGKHSKKAREEER